MQNDVSCLRVRLEDAILKNNAGQRVERHYREQQAHAIN